MHDFTACLLCDRRQRPAGPGGACACLVDPAGRDIVVMVKLGVCPHPDGPRFTHAGEPTDAGRQRPAIPMELWPRKVRAVAALRKQVDEGVGDTLARLFNVLPGYKGMGLGDAFKAFTKKLGLDCGCSDRQAKLNEQYRY